MSRVVLMAVRGNTGGVTFEVDVEHDGKIHDFRVLVTPNGTLRAHDLLDFLAARCLPSVKPVQQAVIAVARGRPQELPLVIVG